MKHLSQAIRSTRLGVIKALEEILGRFSRFPEGHVFRGSWDEHILLEACRILRDRGCHLAPAGSRREFEQLVKLIKESNHEDLSARGEDPRK